MLYIIHIFKQFIQLQQQLRPFT